MSYTVDWLIPQRLVFVQVQNDTPVREWGEIQHVMMRLIEAGSPPVHAIFDTTRVSITNINITQIRSGSGLKTIQHPNMGWYIILQNSVVIRFFASLALQTVSPNNKFMIVTTLQEALDVLRRNDTSLSEAALEQALRQL